MEKKISKEDVLDFFKKNGQCCDKCPFTKECDRVYDLIRAHSTSAFTICTALTMDEETYDLYSE